MASDGADLSSLRFFGTGGSVCPPEIERRFLVAWPGDCVRQVYGMTEFAGAFAHTPWDHEQRAGSGGIAVERSPPDQGRMGRPCLEVADVFRAHGAAWRKANAGHVSLAQLKVMSAIESCRTSALGGHVERCEDCAHERVAYNSCRNRHCPKCQGAAARQWLAEREAELLPAPYYHVVFTLPAAIGVIAFQNKAAVYDLLFKAAAETLTTIAADPKHLGARVGLTAVLHTWGSALTHHPHVHVIVPGGGLSPDGSPIA